MRPLLVVAAVAESVLVVAEAMVGLKRTVAGVLLLLLLLLLLVVVVVVVRMAAAGEVRWRAGGTETTWGGGVAAGRVRHRVRVRSLPKKLLQQGQAGLVAVRQLPQRSAAATTWRPRAATACLCLEGWCTPAATCEGGEGGLLGLVRVGWITARWWTRRPRWVWRWGGLVSVLRLQVNPVLLEGGSVQGR